MVSANTLTEFRLRPWVDYSENIICGFVIFLVGCRLGGALGTSLPQLGKHLPLVNKTCSSQRPHQSPAQQEHVLGQPGQHLHIPRAGAGLWIKALITTRRRSPIYALSVICPLRAAYLSPL